MKQLETSGYNEHYNKVRNGHKINSFLKIIINFELEGSRQIRSANITFCKSCFLLEHGSLLTVQLTSDLLQQVTSSLHTRIYNSDMLAQEQNSKICANNTLFSVNLSAIIFRRLN